MTRISKKVLRKRQPQLPINFPAPAIVPFDYEKERDRVERLAKRLSHNEQEVRDAVLKEVPRYLREICTDFLNQAAAETDDASAKYQLPALSTAEDLDAPLYKDLTLVFDKLCLGLFFCFWHSDKPLVQHDCAYRLSLLVLDAPTLELRLLFIRSFLRRLAEGWQSIDKWRIDKYMALVRKIMFQCILLVAQESETKGSSTKRALKKSKITKDDVASSEPSAVSKSNLTELFCDVVQRVIIHGPAVGLTMHICDLFLVELLRSPDKVSPQLFCDLAKGIPMYAMSKGNFVEKRVLDMFVAPICTGAVEVKRGTDYAIEVIGLLAETVRRMSVSRETKYAVRPTMAEAAEMLIQYLEQMQHPERFEPISSRDRTTRVARELDAAEKAQVRQAKMIEESKKRKALMRKGKAAAGNKRPREEAE